MNLGILNQISQGLGLTAPGTLSILVTHIVATTKAIMPIHYGGAPCKDIKALRDIAEDHKLVLIEDAAESLGSKIKYKMLGTFGHSAMFSFCQNKIITSGEGGMIVTDSKKVYEKLILVRSHGRVENKDGFFSSTQEMDYIYPGFNLRMSSITASLALSQFKRINNVIKMRRQKASYYNKHLSKIKNLKIKTISSTRTYAAEANIVVPVAHVLHFHYIAIN